MSPAKRAKTAERTKRSGNTSAPNVAPGPDASTEELDRRPHEREMRKLDVELVKLQGWVKAKGGKVCSLFEGRDGAGKGGTIKAMTERVSPRVFRVVALPAPTDREKS